MGRAASSPPHGRDSRLVRICCASGPSSAVWAILDKVVDDYIPVADAIEDDVEEVEKDVFDDDIPAPTARIYNLKREVIEFHRAVWPLLNPLETLEQGGFERVPRSCAATSATSPITPSASTSRSAPSASCSPACCRRTSRWSASTRTKTSRRSRRSSAIIAVPTFIASVYGMNFDNMPELRWHYGYAYALALMAVCVVAAGALLQSASTGSRRAYDGGVFPVAHVGGPVFEPLQVAALARRGAAYAFRAMTLAGGAAGAGVAGRLLRRGSAPDRGRLVSPLGHLDDELLLAHMAQHLLMGDIGALLIVLGLTGPLLQPLLAIRGSAGSATSPTRWWRCPSGRSTSTSGTRRSSTRRPAHRTASTPSSTPASSASGC